MGPGGGLFGVQDSQGSPVEEEAPKGSEPQNPHSQSPWTSLSRDLYLVLPSPRSRGDADNYFVPFLGKQGYGNFGRRYLLRR